LVGSKVNIRFIKVKGQNSKVKNQNSPKGMPMAKIQKKDEKREKKKIIAQDQCKSVLICVIRVLLRLEK